jgi:hypothetical protein
MRLLISLFILSTSFQSFSAANFDEMRCKGHLINIGTTIDRVKEACGEPLFEKEDKNDFRIFTYITYKGEGETSRYYLLFRNGMLESSRLEPYNSGGLIWKNTNTLRN